MTYCFRLTTLESSFGEPLSELLAEARLKRKRSSCNCTPVGVFMGCKYTDPNLGYELYSQSYPANTVASDIQAYVADATDLLV